MLKYQAIEGAEKNVTELTDVKCGGWSFSHRESSDSPWIKMPGKLRNEAVIERRVMLINKAKKLLGLPLIEVGSQNAKNWKAQV